MDTDYANCSGPIRNSDCLFRLLRATCMLCLAWLLLAGCAAIGNMMPASPRTGPVELEIGDVVETATGNVITFDDLIRKLSEAAIV
ncbi:MAG: hypothetical protein AB9866_06040 [Syntrophobacteraceae bacterium]